MRVVQINSFGNLSTGSVMRREDANYRRLGYDTWMFWGRGCSTENSRAKNFGTKINTGIDLVRSRLDGKAGFHSKTATKRLLRELDAIDPDLVHLHNLHGYYINIERLFEWLLNHRCDIRWTLHDCWAFTGHCAYFSLCGCDLWKSQSGCNSSCPQLNTYPSTFSRSSSFWNYQQKKKLFTSIPLQRLKIITPSFWLAGLVQESFLSKYSVEVVPNIIDASIFKPTPSLFRKQHDLQDKCVVLGVAFPWTERKGLETFRQLVKILDSSYAVVLVGLSKKQIQEFPQDGSCQVILMEKTDSKKELASLYTMANVFLNPTLEDNYPTVNLEAEACDTPVLTFNTGGSAETIKRPDSMAIDPLNADELKKLISSFSRSISRH